MITPRELELPVQDWRRYQEQALIDIVSSSEPVIIVEAPTGAGKSLLAVAAARLIGARQTAIVCHTKQLQAQYKSVFGDLAEVTGRGNHPCLIQNSTAEDAPCTVLGPKSCEVVGKCPYYQQLFRALEAPISLHNYAYWMNVNDRLFNDLDLLVLDECHLAEDQLRKSVEIGITPAKVYRATESKLPDYGEDYVKWREWASNTYDSLHDVATANIEWSMLDPEAVREIRAIRSLHDDCALLKDLDEDWIIQEAFPRGVRFVPVWVSKFGQDKIFSKSRKTLLLSATILDAQHFCDGLGIPESEVRFLRIPSTFPKENRPVFLMPTVKVRHGMSDHEKEILVDAIDIILEDHPNEKGLIHTANYELTKFICKTSRHCGRMVTHSTADRTTVLDSFKKDKRPSVLVSPSMTTGTDLPEEQCRFIVVAKLPYPNLGDEQIKRRMKFDAEGNVNPRGQDWYLWLTACTLVQSLGRGMRSPEDKCTSYVLDANVTTFIKRVYKILPGWFKEALKEKTNAKIIAAQFK